MEPAVETETKSVTDVKLVVEEPEEGEESLRGHHLPEALEGNVVGEEGDLETGAPEEHDRARPVTAFQIFGVALPRVSRLQPKFLGDRSRDHCRSWAGFGQLQGPAEGEKGAVTALRGGGEELTLVLKGKAEDSFALGKEGGSPPFQRTVENPLGPDQVGESRRKRSALAEISGPIPPGSPVERKVRGEVMTRGRDNLRCSPKRPGRRP